MAWRLFTDSGHWVELLLDSSTEFSGGTLADRSRAALGDGYDLVRSRFREWSLEVSHVDSATVSIVNSWWDSSAQLYLCDLESPATIYSVRLSGEAAPFRQFIRPYYDEWQGVIELEER